MQRIHVIDSHTGGEPTRVVIDGGPDLGGGSLADRLERFRAQHDAFRSAVVNEPRGNDVIVGAILVPSTDPSCVAGVVFFNNVGVLNMCGHGTIGVGVTLGHMGRITSGRHRLETPVGEVAFDYDGANRVALENVPSYRHAARVPVNVEGVGTIHGDITWGGNWFFLVEDHGWELDVSRVEELTGLTWRVRQALEREGITGKDGGLIDHIELNGPPRDPANHGRNFVLCPGKAYDRSPCGTGTSAKLACLHADGKLAPGQVWRQESIVGSVFEGSVRLDGDRLIPRIVGSAYVVAEATLLIDPRDPFAWGINIMTRRVVILGAGVIGTACAHYLREAGCEVTLIDRGRLGGGCSHANCGFVCPSHVLPHAGPGAINMILRTMMRRNSPLAVRPRLDWSLFSWMWRFATRCYRSSMLRSARAIQAMLNASRRLYDELLAKEPLTADWQTQGLLFVFQTRQAFEHYAEVDRMLRSELALGATPYTGRSLVDLEPALKLEVAGAWHYACDAQVRPDQLLAGWKNSLLARGVDLREGADFTGFVRSGGRAVAARTSQGDISADEFVVATGAWTPLLARELRCSVPIQPGKGYSVTMPRPALCPRYPLIFEEHRVAVSPFATGYRIGSTMEFNGYDDHFDPRRVELLVDSARLYLREPVTSPVEEQWWGWRPMVPDGVPIMGPVPRQPNVWLATGHGMLGLSMATGTGRLIAELVTRSGTHLDPAPYSVARF